MDQFTADVLSKVVVQLTVDVLKALGARGREALVGSEAEQAVSRSVEAGVVALVAQASTDAPGQGEILEDIFHAFFVNPSVVQQVSELPCGRPMNREKLAKLFEEAGYDAATLPGLDLASALDAFEAAFLHKAVTEGGLRDRIQGGSLLEQTRLQRGIHDGVRQLIEKGQALQPDPMQRQRQEALQRYLSTLRKLCNALPLAPMGEEAGQAGAEVTLNQVYITLNTTEHVRRTKAEREEHIESAGRFGFVPEERALSVLEAAVQRPRLVILGDPGSGKSTFVNYLTYLLVGARLGKCNVPEGWPHGDLLPVRVVLKELVSYLPSQADVERDSGEKRVTRLTQAVWNYVAKELEVTYRAAEALSLLEQEVADCHALLIFDGLDEVAPQHRPLAREAVEAFVQRCGENRALVTCRWRSYEDKARLSAFPDVRLAPFDEGQVRDFARRWYAGLAERGPYTQQQAEDKGKNLADAATALMELAQNPLLLTTMALVHTTDVELPKKRAVLYRRCVEVLLKRWEQHKAGKSSLAELGIDEHNLLPGLWEVAYEAHKRGGTREEGDLPRSAVVAVLAKHLDSEDKAGKFLDYVDARAGLLVGKGGPTEQVYNFPHRSFQEFLAGCHLAISRLGLARELLPLLAQGDRWERVARMAAEHLLYNNNAGGQVLDVAYRLCPVTEPASQPDWRGVLWAGAFAAEAGRPTVEKDAVPDGGMQFLQRLVPRLRNILEKERLAALERAETGDVLAHLGDPRESVTTVDGMEFCCVPAGQFWMGSNEYDDEKPEHLNKALDHDYWIARYPVTVAQFRAYLESSGRGPVDPDSLRGLPNHPVIYVTWHEARQFCAWLTDRWQATGRLPKGWSISLPSEAEWEKAARGGLHVPEQRLVGVAFATEHTPPMIENPQPKRRFPWGDKPDPNLANYDDTGIGTTSAVGCFPGGASLYGAEDLSGNVWEWTRSLWGPDWQKPAFKYPYKRDKREDPGSPDKVLRVLRGGAFNNPAGGLRCACRPRDHPYNHDWYLGFRVVASPILL